MEKISKVDLKNIRGGGINLGLVTAIGAGIAFIVGIIDGYLRPLACH